MSAWGNRDQPSKRPVSSKAVVKKSSSGLASAGRGQRAASRTVAKPGASGQLVPNMESFPMDKLPDGTLAPKGYTMRPVVAAENYDVVSFARAMNDDFAPRVKKLFDPERKAAVEAQKTGVYIGWRLPGQKFDCQRISDTSKCFCGHLLGEHGQYNGKSVRVPCGMCACKAFQWIPSRPEDVGEFWHQRRRNFDPSTWRAKCRCKHTHEEHDFNGMKRCRARGCPCAAFDSNFLCAACDKHWEEHETFFETEEMRRREGLPVGEAYLPFAEMPNLRNAVLTGDEHDDSVYNALTSGQGHIPIMNRPQGNEAAFRPGGGAAGGIRSSGFKPVYD